MEKIIYIGDKEVKLKANAMQALIFRREFGRDIMEVQGSIMNIVNVKPNGEVVLNMDGLKGIDGVGIVQMIWTLAKAADSTIPPLEQWLDEFDTFPIMEVFAEAYEVLLANFVSTSKIKNAKAVVKPQHKG